MKLLVFFLENISIVIHLRLTFTLKVFLMYLTLFVFAAMISIRKKTLDPVFLNKQCCSNFLDFATKNEAQCQPFYERNIKRTVIILTSNFQLKLAFLEE